MTSPNIAGPQGQRAYVLISTLVMLLVLTFLAVSMYHSFNAQENMAANSKEKARAFQMAQSTLQYGEYQLKLNALALAQGGNCSSTTPLTAVTICATPVNMLPATSSNPMTLANGMPYATMEIQPTLSQNGGQINTYYANPQVYIQYLGIAPDLTGQLYQVTALGYGGNANAVAVVQSTFETSSGVKNLGGL
jgi:type IV pilus assembly protein PilX